VAESKPLVAVVNNSTDTAIEPETTDDGTRGNEASSAFRVALAATVGMYEVA
jgi:hypothetical protein